MSTSATPNNQRSGRDSFLRTSAIGSQRVGYPCTEQLSCSSVTAEFLGCLPADIRADLESDPGAAARTRRNALASPADARYMDTRHPWPRVLGLREFRTRESGGELGVKLVECTSSQAAILDATGSHPPGETTGYRSRFERRRIDARRRDPQSRERRPDSHTATLDGDGEPDARPDDILTPLFTPQLGRRRRISRTAHELDDRGNVCRARRRALTRAERAREHAALGLAQYFFRRRKSRPMPRATLGEVNPLLTEPLTTTCTATSPNSWATTDGRVAGRRSRTGRYDCESTPNASSP